AASLIEGARAAVEALAESDSAAALAGVATRLRSLKGFDAALEAPLELLQAAQAQVDEAVHALRPYAERVELDPRRVDEVERRLDAIHSTARKFKVSPPALLELAEALAARLAELEIDADPEALRAQEAAAGARYGELAALL